MSSFRPEVETATPIFVPMPLGGVRSGTGTEDEGVAFETQIEAADVETAERAAEEAPAEPTAIDPETVATLEAAAFERGIEAGRAEAHGLDAARGALEAAGRRLAAAATSDLGANRAALLALAGEIARHWVGVELATSPSSLASMLDEAVDRLGAPDAARILLAADDLARLDTHDDGWRTRLAGDGIFAFEAGADLAPGEFRIETDASSIEGRTATVLAELMDRLEPATDAPSTDSDVADTETEDA